MNNITFFKNDFIDKNIYAECYYIEHKYNYIFSIITENINIDDTSLIVISSNSIEFVDLTNNDVKLNNIPTSNIFIIAITKFNNYSTKPFITVNFEYNVNILKLFNYPLNDEDTTDVKFINKFIEKNIIENITLTRINDIYILQTLFTLLNIKNKKLLNLVNEIYEDIKLFVNNINELLNDYIFQSNLLINKFYDHTDPTIIKLVNNFDSLLKPLIEKLIIVLPNLHYAFNNFKKLYENIKSDNFSILYSKQLLYYITEFIKNYINDKEQYIYNSQNIIDTNDNTYASQLGFTELFPNNSSNILIFEFTTPNIEVDELSMGVYFSGNINTVTNTKVFFDDRIQIINNHKICSVNGNLISFLYIPYEKEYWIQKTNDIPALLLNNLKPNTTYIFEVINKYENPDNYDIAINIIYDYNTDNQITIPINSSTGILIPDYYDSDGFLSFNVYWHHSSYIRFTAISDTINIYLKKETALSNITIYEQDNEKLIVTNTENYHNIYDNAITFNNALPFKDDINMPANIQIHNTIPGRDYLLYFMTSDRFLKPECGILVKSNDTILNLYKTDFYIENKYLNIRNKQYYSNNTPFIEFIPDTTNINLYLRGVLCNNSTLTFCNDINENIFDGTINCIENNNYNNDNNIIAINTDIQFEDSVTNSLIHITNLVPYKSYYIKLTGIENQFSYLGLYILNENLNDIYIMPKVNEETFTTIYNFEVNNHYYPYRLVFTATTDRINIYFKGNCIAYSYFIDKIYPHFAGNLHILSNQIYSRYYSNLSNQTILIYNNYADDVYPNFNIYEDNINNNSFINITGLTIGNTYICNLILSTTCNRNDNLLSYFGVYIKDSNNNKIQLYSPENYGNTNKYQIFKDIKKQMNFYQFTATCSEIDIYLKTVCNFEDFYLDIIIIKDINSIINVTPNINYEYHPIGEKRFDTYNYIITNPYDVIRITNEYFEDNITNVANITISNLKIGANYFLIFNREYEMLDNYFDGIYIKNSNNNDIIVSKINDINLSTHELEFQNDELIINNFGYTSLFALSSLQSTYTYKFSLRQSRYYSYNTYLYLSLGGNKLTSSNIKIKFADINVTIRNTNIYSIDDDGYIHTTYIPENDYWIEDYTALNAGIKLGLVTVPKGTGFINFTFTVITNGNILTNSDIYIYLYMNRYYPLTISLV